MSLQLIVVLAEELCLGKRCLLLHLQCEQTHVHILEGLQMIVEKLNYTE